MPFDCKSTVCPVFSARAVNNVELRDKVRQRRRTQLFHAHHINGLRIGANMVQPDCLNHRRQAMRWAGDVVVAALVGAINIIRDNAKRAAPRSGGTNPDPQQRGRNDTATIQLHMFPVALRGNWFLVRLHVFRRLTVPG